MERIKRRLVWAVVMLVFFLLLAAARTGYIQLVRGEYYARKALAGDTAGMALEDYSRGQVLDRHGRSLTGSYQSNRIAVFPELLDNPDAAARALSGITGTSQAEVRKMLPESTPALLPLEITPDQAGVVQQSGLKGVVVVPFSRRYGPRPLAAHMVGHLGKIKDLREIEDLARAGGKSYQISDWVGRQGLEYFYEKELRGVYPSSYAGLYTDALGRPLGGLPVLVDTGLGDPTRSDLVTTIDSDIQDMVERVLDRHAKKGAVVVMDRRTGDILAIASRPAYSPDPARGDLLPASGDERFVNQALSLFQPGSIFKVVVAAAALTEGVARPGTLYYCKGSEGWPVRCWKEDGHGTLTLEEAFAQSCNPVFSGLGLELGPERLIACARSMGLGSQEIAGYPADPDPRQDLGLIAGRYNLAGSSVGQGPVLATPVQLTAMVNTVANGGIYLQPRLIREIRPAVGPARIIGGAEPVRAISPGVAGQVGQMMAAVTRRGVGHKAWVEGMGTAGKTGSAQLGDSDRVNAWFSGYGPLDNPRYTITVLVRDGVSGGDTAAPVFREIMENLFQMETRDQETTR